MDIASTGKYIITCSKANDLVIWDLKGQILTNVELHLGDTYRARVSPCGRFIGVSGNNLTHFIDYKILQTYVNNISKLSCLGFTPDVNIFEVVFTKSGDFKQVTKAFDLTGHLSGINDFNFSADSSRIATVSRDGTYHLYDTKSNRIIKLYLFCKLKCHEMNLLITKSCMYLQLNLRKEKTHTYF